MPERDYLDYEDWLYAGGREGTGQSLEAPPQGAPPPAAAPYNFRSDPNWSPTSTWMEDGQNYSLDPGSEWWWNPEFNTWNIRRRPGQNVDTPPPPPPGPGGGPGGGFGGPGPSGPSAYDSAGFQWPQYQPAPFANPMQPFAYENFSYGDFSAPTIEQARNEPGFQFSFEQGQKALENAAAARGTLRTGGTMKDLISWGQKAADQNYGNVYARAADTYDRNRANAFGNWSGNLQKELSARGINWGELTDTYDRNTQNAKDAFNADFRAKELTFADLYNRWAKQGDWTTTLAGGVDY